LDFQKIYKQQLGKQDMIHPIGERVLLEAVAKVDKTSGGIYLPEAAQEEKKEGVVVAVGKFKDGTSLPLEAGNKILYGGYSNEDFEYEGKQYVLVEYKDVLARLD
jgi:chaperonin GroES